MELFYSLIAQVAETVETAKEAVGIVNPENVQDLFGGLMSALQSQSWVLVVAFLVLILVFVAKKLFEAKKIIKDPAKFDKFWPWIAAAMGAITTIAVSIISSIPTDLSAWLFVVLNGLAGGFASVGLWEGSKNTVKKITAKKVKK